MVLFQQRRLQTFFLTPEKSSRRHRNTVCVIFTVTMRPEVGFAQLHVVCDVCQLLLSVFVTVY